MPSERIAINSTLIRQYCLHEGWRPPAQGHPFLFGFRQAVPYPNDDYALAMRDNVLDHWNDTLGIGGSLWRIFQGTTDPGAPYTRSPLDPDGAAWLLPGTYRYVLGRHKSIFVNALVPAPNEKTPVRRDRDQDGRPEYGEKVEIAWGINIHKGGSISRPVSKWSAGCQVLPREEWEEFWRTIRGTGRKEWDYTLIDAWVYRRWLLSRS